MLEEPTFADLEYAGKKHKTRREVFLERMDGLIPWERLEERIRPLLSQGRPGKAALPPVGDVAGALCPGIPQPERPSDGGPIV